MARSNGKSSAALIDQVIGEASWLLSHAQALTDYGRSEEAAAEWTRALPLRNRRPADWRLPARVARRRFSASVPPHVANGSDSSRVPLPCFTPRCRLNCRWTTVRESNNNGRTPWRKPAKS